VAFKLARNVCFVLTMQRWGDYARYTIGVKPCLAVFLETRDMVKMLYV